MSIGYFLLKNKHKKSTLMIWYLTAYYRAKILLVPSKYQEHLWGEKNVESQEDETEENYWIARFISKEVNRVADRTPWESKCLVRALTAQYLLYRKGIKSTLYFGVKPDEKGAMTAHAWIRCGKFYVTGGNGDGYAMVGKYSK